MDFINGFLNLNSLVSFLFGLVPSGYFLYKIASFIIRKEIRLFKNLERNIYLMTVNPQKNLQREKELLEKNGLYKVHNQIYELSDLGLLDTMENFSVFVVAYSKEYKHYQKIIDRAKKDIIPIIILAGPRDIIDEHMAIFSNYPYFEMCNTSSRLLTTIFNLSVITPNEKR